MVVLVVVPWRWCAGWCHGVGHLLPTVACCCAMVCGICCTWWPAAVPCCGAFAAQAVPACCCAICCTSWLFLPHDVRQDFCFEKTPAQSSKCPAQYFARIQLGILGGQQNKPQPKIRIILFSTIFQSFII